MFEFGTQAAPQQTFSSLRYHHLAPPVVLLYPRTVQNMPSLPAAGPAPNYSVHMAGFLFTREAVAQLCIKAYAMNETYVRHFGPQDAAFLHFQAEGHLDSPKFVRIKVRTVSGKTADRFVLVCRMAYVNPGLNVPDLTFDAPTRAYADYWFPPSIRALDDFKDVKYVKTRFPQDDLPSIRYIETKLERRHVAHRNWPLVASMMKRVETEREVTRPYLPPRFQPTFEFEASHIRISSSQPNVAASALAP
ncbi:uncharacterized protein BXZ73DRAFT_103288 [Epithele typhae]|uniref:uncharacterized protein n=1 Tax=Epithele typhae TaxID=378194 RepID=UPI002007BC80|nr:uncharacterized protein BXZ73DRAFT_103288 [Epithele typhae]KAH9925408.1 hypothetical protein BXZ73DRAFT_103288 [Epithele typhae]